MSDLPGWVFVLPSLVLVGLIGLPLLALVWRSVSKDFLTYVLSATTFSALKLSLLTSIISVGLALVTGTPLAYLLVHWKFPAERCSTCWWICRLSCRRRSPGSPY